MLSRVTNQLSGAWAALHPLHNFPDWRTFFEGYISSRDVTSDLSDDIDFLFDMAFRNRTRLLSLHNYTVDIEDVKNIAQPFNSFHWQLEAGTHINQLWNGVENAIALLFGMNGPQPLDPISLSNGRVIYKQQAMDEILHYFSLSAGSLLLVLALLSLFARRGHEQNQWLSMWANIFIGFAFILPISSLWVNGGSIDGLYSSHWTLVLVVVGYFAGKSRLESGRRSYWRE